MRSNRWLAPPVATAAAAGEALALPLLALGLGIWLSPLDPLGAQAAFPWVWLAPVLLALRYGPLAGLVAAGVLLAGWLALAPLGFPGGAFPKFFFLGGLITTMICGEFASIWRNRVRRAEAMQIYLDQRLDDLTHEHYLLRLSHDRLEQDLIARPLSMRDALGRLRSLPDTDPSALPGAMELLRLLAQYVGIEEAALHEVRAGRPEGRALACLGAAQTLSADDPMLRQALREGRLAHVQHDGADGTRYLVAAPIAGGDGQARGVLVVTRMPFFALHDEALQTLDLMLGYYADGLQADAVARELRAHHPACPHDFAFELQRMAHIHASAGVRSALVALEFSADAGDLPLLIRRQQRALDVTWLMEGEHAVLVNLLPLAAESAADGYLNRVDAWLQAQRGQTLEQAGLRTHVFLVDQTPPAALLDRLLGSCRVADQIRPVGAGA